MSEPIKNNTPEERLTYQLCIEIINKIAKEYGELNVPGILDPLIAERIDLAIKDVLTKLEDLDGKTDIKLEDINKIKEDCQNIIAHGNELSANFVEAFALFESIVAHVNDIELNIELKVQQIETIKEAIEVLKQNINSLVDRAALIEKNIDNLYREFVKKYNHSVQIYDSVREWKEQIEKNILLSISTLEELKILFPQAQEINKKLEEAIAIGIHLEEEIINAKQTIIKTGQEQVNNMNSIKTDFDTLADKKTNTFVKLVTDKTSEFVKLVKDSTTAFTNLVTEKTDEFTKLVTDKIEEFTKLFTDSTTSFTKLVTDKISEFTTLANQKIAEFLNLIYPVRITYTQHPNKTTGLFDETETPRALVGGDWELVETELINNVPTRNTNNYGSWEKYPNRTLIYRIKGEPKTNIVGTLVYSKVTLPIPYINTGYFVEVPTLLDNFNSNRPVNTRVGNILIQNKTTTSFNVGVIVNYLDGNPSKPFCIVTGFWKNPADPISEDEEKNYVKIWKRVAPPTEPTEVK